MNKGQALKKPFDEQEVEETAVGRSLIPWLGCYGLCSYCLTLCYFYDTTELIWEGLPALARMEPVTFGTIITQWKTLGEVMQ